MDHFFLDVDLLKILSIFESSVQFVSVCFMMNEKKNHPYTMSFIKLLSGLSQPFHLMYSLSPFPLITFSSLNSVWLVFCNSFSQNIPLISSPSRLLTTCVHSKMFSYSLDTKTSSDQFGMCSFAKIFLFFELYTWSPTFNLGFFLLCSTPYHKGMHLNISRIDFDFSMIYVVILVIYFIQPTYVHIF